MINKIRYKFIQLLGYLLSNIVHGDGNWLTIGDSLTKPLMYQSLSMKNKKYKLINCGFPGMSLATNSSKNSICDRVYEYCNYEDVKLITIMGGTNDFVSNVCIGDINSFDTHTFYGSLNKMINVLSDAYKTADIILITPPKRIFDDVGEFNPINLKIEDYAVCMKNIAKKYNLKVVDLCSSSKINLNNFREYTIDKIHLNLKGNKVLADMLQEYI